MSTPLKSSKTRAELIPGGQKVQKGPQEPKIDLFDEIRGYSGMGQIGARVVKLGKKLSKNRFIKISL